MLPISDAMWQLCQCWKCCYSQDSGNIPIVAIVLQQFQHLKLLWYIIADIPNVGINSEQSCHISTVCGSRIVLKQVIKSIQKLRVLCWFQKCKLAIVTKCFQKRKIKKSKTLGLLFASVKGYLIFTFREHFGTKACLLLFTFLNQCKNYWLLKNIQHDLFAEKNSPLRRTIFLI